MEIIRTFRGHSYGVNCVAVLPDGNFVSGSNDGTLRLWNTNTGETLRTFGEHLNAVICVAVLPNGNFVSGSRDTTLHLWNTNTGHIRMFRGHTNTVSCIAVLPNGNFVSGSEDKTLRLWNTITGKTIQIFVGHSHFVTCVATLPDGNFVSGSEDKTLHIWNTHTGKVIQTFEDTHAVNCVTVLPDGNLLSGSQDKTLIIWNTNTSDIRTFEGHTKGVYFVVVLPDGNFISASEDRTLRLWNTTTGETIQTIEEHPHFVRSIAVLPDGNFVSTSIAVLPDGNFVSGVLEKFVFLWKFQPDTRWEGFSKGDMEKFDSIFSEEANNFSCCPVCMRYVQRVDGCMYMSHNCYNEPGADTVEENLYNMYKNPEGFIYWCTICGRICSGHRHYTLGASSRKLDLVPIRPGADPFAKDCTGEGGGGIKEKLARFSTLRTLAHELQKEVGKIPRKQALEELIMEMWSAPISKLAMRYAKNNLVAKKFRLPANVFPAPVVSNNVANIVRESRNAGLLPTVGPGYNNISTTNDDAVIQFHHRLKNGEINHHEDSKINTESFQDYIQSNLNDGKAGPCWHKDCTAIIHPDEIMELVSLGVFPEELYKRYKDAFNRVQRGGGGDILQEAITAQCVLWGKNGNRATQNRRNNIKNRKRTRTSRR